MSFAAYAVAIKLNLVDGLSPALTGISKLLLANNAHATELEKRLHSISSLLKTGALMTGAGFGLAWAMKAATGEAVKYEQQLNRLKALNLGGPATANLTSLADQIARGTRGTSQREALRLVTETQSITGDVGHTRELTPLLAKMRFGIETYMSGGGHGEGHGATAERQFADIVKVMEMRGLMRNFSESRMNSMADLFVKNYVASGGQVRPSEFLQLMKTGGVAAKSVNDDFMFALGHIMQEKGGFRSGTAFMSMYQNMVAGRMPQQVAETLKKLGLLDSSAIHYGKTGHITKVDPGGLKNSNLLMSRPDLYLQQEILPALAKHGVDINNQQAVLLKLNSLTGQRTASDMLAQLYLESGQIGNYMRQAKNSMGVNALYNQAENSTVGKQIELQARFNDLEKTWGQAILPLQIKALEELIPLAKDFNSLLERHPALIKGVVWALGLLAGSLMLAGPITMLAGAFKALSLALSFSGVGGVGGAVGVRALAAAIAGGGGLSLVAGLAALGAAVAGLFFVFDKILPNHRNGDRDPDHPGQHWKSGVNGRGGKWEPDDPSSGNAHAGERFVRSGRSGYWVKINTQVNLDGKKVGQAVSTHMAKSLGSGMSTGAVDGNVALPMPGVK